MSESLRRMAFVAVLIAGPGQVYAQDTLEVELPTVEIQATRAFETTINAARSVYVKLRDRAAHEPGISLQRSLRGIPGIRISDRGHFALGERLLVRGMGYRAAFGVRGTQAFLDGIPLTMADGQSVLDVVDPALIGRTEALRGPSSLYWGNTSGGVLFLSTLEDTSAVRVRYMRGGYGLSQILAAATLRQERQNLHVFGSRLARNGYRAHSSGSFIRFGARGRRTIGASSVLSVIANAAIQDVEAPGSLTEDQLMTDPRQADPRYINQGAGKESIHIQGGVKLVTQTRFGAISAVAYGINRILDNPLTFAWIDLDRLAGGVYIQLHNQAGAIAWSAGLDARTQQDNRRAYDNDGGNRSATVQLDQQERVRSLGGFGTFQYRFGQRFGATAGLRLDGIRYDMTDRYVENGDQTGDRNFRALSASIGAYRRYEELTAYGNISTSFETPTTTELINSPVRTGGFNQDLNPQRTTGLEIGLRGLAEDLRLSIDAALFQLHLRDRLVPTQNAEGRTWFTNAGRNRHEGLEVALSWPVEAPIKVDLAYNYSHFVFLNDPGRGLQIPGVPTHYWHLALQIASPSGWLAELATEHASDIWADGGNQTRSSGYTALDLYLARTNWLVGSMAIAPFCRIQNLLNTKYNGSLVVNAFGGRYFEPAAERTFQLGLNLML